MTPESEREMDRQIGAVMDWFVIGVGAIVVGLVFLIAAVWP